MTRFAPLVLSCLISAAVSMAAAIGPVAAETKAESSAKTSPAYVVIDVETGKVLAKQRATERRYPASTTKLMTAYLVLNALRESELSLDSPVVMTRRASMEAPSKMGYEPGSVMRVDNALKMMLVKSANDVAYALGQAVADGSMEDFVEEMNEAAERLGMDDTQFINPNGLPGDGQYSTAKDLAILARAIRQEFPSFSAYFGIEAISTGSSLMKNGNKLLGRFDGADGMKTGYICASGFNLVSSATRNGRTLVAVVLGANGTVERESLSAEILQKGFGTPIGKIDLTVDRLPDSAGKPLDTSGYICSQEGRTARANDRVEDAKDEEVFGSPYMHELGRPPVSVAVGLGGAEGNDMIEPGVSIIASYGIPIPQPRPERPQDASDRIATFPPVDEPGVTADLENQTAEDPAAPEPRGARSGGPPPVTALQPPAPATGAADALAGPEPLAAEPPAEALSIEEDGGDASEEKKTSRLEIYSDSNVTVRLNAAEKPLPVPEGDLRGAAD